MNREDFDSDQELYAYWYFEQLKEEGFINDIIHHPEPFELSESVNSSYVEKLKTKDKIVSEELLKGHLYTADFIVVWSDKAKGVFFDLLDGGTRFKKRSSQVLFVGQVEGGDYLSVIEVKPLFDQNNMTRLAKINQKWVWDKHKYFINIMVPEKWMKNTFTPYRYLITNKSGKPRKIKFEVRSLIEYLKRWN